MRNLFRGISFFTVILLAVPAARAAKAVASDKSFHVQVPHGWKAKKPPKKYLLQITPPVRQRGFFHAARSETVRP